MERHRDEQRKEERVPADLRVDLGSAGIGTARDVSPSGIYFEMESGATPGMCISFDIDFETPGGKLILSCLGEIVRVERRDSRMGVGVKILTSQLQPRNG